MSEWRRWSRGAGFKVEDDSVLVDLNDGRIQRVWVQEDADTEAIRIWSIAARKADIGHVDDPNVLAWHRNRTSDLVGFKIDNRGRLIGEAWVPRAGLVADEWVTYVRALALACDRLEYLLTGTELS